MTKIKQVLNSDFMQFTQLVVKMYKITEPKISQFDVIDLLVGRIKLNPTFVAFGLYEKTKLVGIIYGYNKISTDFYISGLYCLNNTLGLFKLFKEIKNFCLEQKYKSISYDTKNKMLDKFSMFKAEKISSKYKLEL